MCQKETYYLMFQVRDLLNHVPSPFMKGVFIHATESLKDHFCGVYLQKHQSPENMNRLGDLVIWCIQINFNINNKALPHIGNNDWLRKE
jgi:hypothetical protein